MRARHPGRTATGRSRVRGPETTRAGSRARPKPDLVLVHSFYANSYLLRGLIDFLERRYRVHAVDLPGFAPREKPLARVSLDEFGRHVARRIRELGLRSYLLGGISFGFTVVGRVSLPPGCRGIVAIFPYLGADSLALRRGKLWVYRLAVNFLAASKLGGRLWRTQALERFAFWWSSYPPGRVRLILDQMDGRTFFDTARIILNESDGTRFHALPHVLILNPRDATVLSPYCRARFERTVSELCLVETELDHYPLEPTREYFEAHFKTEDMKRIEEFLNRRAGAGPPEAG
jgi:pimeloyl-ACP methyl ester carboxylesterase